MERTNHAKTWKNERDNGRDQQSESGCSCCAGNSMEEDRMPKKIFTQELEGTRRRGRPRKGWKVEVERDLQVLGVRRWRELVADREIRKDIV